MDNDNVTHTFVMDKNSPKVRGVDCRSSGNDRVGGAAKRKRKGPENIDNSKIIQVGSKPLSSETKLALFIVNRL